MTTCLIAGSAAVAVADEYLVRIPMEKAEKAVWTHKKQEGSLQGSILYAAESSADVSEESKSLRTWIPKAMKCRLWVRYYKENNASSGFAVLLRNESEEVFASPFFNFEPYLPQAKPYNKKKADNGMSGFVWDHADIVIEHPMNLSVSVTTLRGGGRLAPRKIDAMIIADNVRWDPSKLQNSELTKIGEAAARDTKNVPPHASLYSSRKKGELEIELALINCASVYTDHARPVKWGMNRDNRTMPDSHKFGITSMIDLDPIGEMSSAEAVKYKSPEGRFVNAKKEVGHTWSLAFEPARKDQEATIRKRFEAAKDDPRTGAWRICSELGGYMDYSAPSISAFRKWLKGKHGSLDALNGKWKSSHENFEGITPPAEPGDDYAAWLEFREFSNVIFSETVAEYIAFIQKNDPKKRPCIGQNSNADLLIPHFTSLRPMDYEQFIDIGLKNASHVGMDVYSADDTLACEFDLLRSLSGGRIMLNREWNVHSADPRLAARSFWLQIMKGVQGIYMFQYQEGTFHDSYPKWALLKNDFSPKSKLMALVNACHEVRRLEPLLVSCQPMFSVKPVALYYSRIDLSLEKPFRSMWGGPLNSPYHVYGALRGLGYAVRWITPTQISRGELNDVGAVVMLSAQHVPREAATKLKEWVEQGGSVIADGLPGAFDEYGVPQATLASVFGVKPNAPKNMEGTLAMQESSQGYGEVTIAAMTQDEISSSVGEVWQQWDSNNPVLKEVGEFTLSGLGYRPMECFAGEVIGMTYEGRPGLVMNHFGKGHALYSNMLLGTLCDAGPAPSEWESSHSGMSFGKILHAFLKHSGIEVYAQSQGLSPKVASKLRTETPMVSPDGNIMVGITSYNDEQVPAFRMNLKLPKLNGAMHFYAITDSGRNLEEIKSKVEGERVILEIPSFDVYATLLEIRAYGIMLGVRLDVGARDGDGFEMLQPNQLCKVHVNIWNLSPKASKAGELRFHLPEGWILKSDPKSISGLEAWSIQSVTVDIQTPTLCSRPEAQPISVKFVEDGGRESVCTTVVRYSF